MVTVVLGVSANSAFAALNCNDTRTVCSGGLGGVNYGLEDSSIGG